MPGVLDSIRILVGGTIAGKSIPRFVQIVSRNGGRNVGLLPGWVGWTIVVLVQEMKAALCGLHNLTDSS